MPAVVSNKMVEQETPKTILGMKDYRDEAGAAGIGVVPILDGRLMVGPGTTAGKILVNFFRLMAGADITRRKREELVRKLTAAGIII